MEYGIGIRLFVMHLEYNGKKKQVEDRSHQSRTDLPGFWYGSSKQNEKQTRHQGAFLQQLVPDPDPYQQHADQQHEQHGREVIHQRYLMDGPKNKLIKGHSLVFRHQGDPFPAEIADKGVQEDPDEKKEHSGNASQPVIFENPKQDHRSNPNKNIIIPIKRKPTEPTCTQI
jgi:hypothetical protein